jgi:ATP-dependent Lhr-like helicase
MLRQARKFYREARLRQHMVVMDGDAVLLVPWAGDLAQNALVLMLRLLGLESGGNEGLIVRCAGWSLERLKAACGEVLNLRETDFLEMLKDVENLAQSKWDWALPRDLLVQSYASTHLDIAGAKRVAATVVA